MKKKKIIIEEQTIFDNRNNVTAENQKKRQT
jgi:hypothetical protein